MSDVEYSSMTNLIRNHPIFSYLYKRYCWNTSEVGHDYEYPEDVHHYNLYANYRVLMELFMRKCICRKYDIPCSDGRTEWLLKCSNFENVAMKKAYQDYCNPNLDAINIIDQIKLLALCHRLAHNEENEDAEAFMSMKIYISNFKSIMKYVSCMPYKSVQCKERCNIAIGYIYVKGAPDFIFDGNVILQVATSKYSKVYTEKKTKMFLYMWAHYSANYYLKNVSKIYKIIIYNPLLGLEHQLAVSITPLIFQKFIDFYARYLPKKEIFFKNI